jgi:hypothetical protein
MEQRDYIIIGLVALLAFQQCEMWQIKKERFYSKLSSLALIRWMDEVHHIKAPEPEKDKAFEKIILELKDNDYVRKGLDG